MDDEMLRKLREGIEAMRDEGAKRIAWGDAAETQRAARKRELSRPFAPDVNLAEIVRELALTQLIIESQLFILDKWIVDLGGQMLHVMEALYLLAETNDSDH
jgi:hypothetical protein